MPTCTESEIPLLQELAAQYPEVSGAAVAHALHRATVAAARYTYRYLLVGACWFNDEAADDDQPHNYGGLLTLDPPHPP